MSLMERYQSAVDELFAKIRDTQTDKLFRLESLWQTALFPEGKLF